MESIKAVCEFLNQMLKADSETVELLFNYRVKCNRVLGSVCLVNNGKDEQHDVSFIGVINSILNDSLGIKGRIAIVVDSDTRKIIKFQEWTGNN